MLQKCKVCGLEFPKTTKYFKKYNSKNNNIEPGYCFHSVCKECENKRLVKDNWKDGLLKCHICGKYFPESTFHKVGNSKKYSYRNNRDNRCPQCKSIQNKHNREKFSDNEKLKSILYNRLYGAKDRATKNKIEFNISIEDLLSLWNSQNGLCAISNVPMTFCLDNGRTFTNVSIDRINPNLGYIKENIQLVCMAVNQMKSDMSLEELYMFCEAIINNKGKK